MTEQEHLINLIKHPLMYSESSLVSEWGSLNTLKTVIEESLDEVWLNQDGVANGTNRLLPFVKDSCTHAWHYDDSVKMNVHHGAGQFEIDMPKQLDNINRTLKFITAYICEHYSGSAPG